MTIRGGKILTFAADYLKVFFTHGTSFVDKLINVINTR